MLSRELDLQLVDMVNASSTLSIPAEELEATDLQPRLSNVRRGGEDVLWLVGHMMKLSQLKTLRDNNRMASRFELMAGLRSELEGLRARAQAKRLTISFNSLRKNVDVSGLEGELRMVLGELLHNAIWYNDEGGHISINVNTTPDQVAVRIFSTGGCVPADQLRAAGEAWSFESHRPTMGRDELRLRVLMAVSGINQAHCQIQPHETGGMVALVYLPRAAGAGQTQAA